VSLFIALIVTIVWWVLALIGYFSVLGPARGGQYSEAVVGQPHFINPLLAPGSSAVSDRLLTKLLFSGLYAYDNNGELQSDIAKDFERSDDGKQYTISLREDVFWHDGEQLTADDVVFTINIAKDVNYDTVVNALRVAWRDVTVEKKDEFTVVFTLDKNRGDFLHLLTLGILPQHIWKDISPVQFQLAEFNIKPIGVGPYVYVKHDFGADGLIDSYSLSAHKEYHHGEPLISKVVMQVFPDRVLAAEAYQNGLVSGVTADSRDLIETLIDSNQSKAVLERPSYFGIFFNQTKSVPLAFDEVREALLFATDRQAIIDEVFGASAFAVASPLFLGMESYVKESEQPEYNLDQAKKELEDKGWKLGADGIRVREQDSTRLAFGISVNADQIQLVQAAELVAAQWALLGAEVSIDSREKDDLDSNVITTRTYDSLLTFHPMRWDQPNLQALWHSREKNHPGLNYAGMQDGPLDSVLDELQTESDSDRRTTLYEQVQSRIKVEDPAVFLFATSFLFAYKDDIKGVELRRVNAPQDRFSAVHKWYIKEKRQWGSE